MRRTRPAFLFATAAPAIPAPPGRAAEGPRSLASRTPTTAARWFLRHHAADHGIDPGRIDARGAAAGGPPAPMPGTAGPGGDPRARDPVDRASGRVQAVACSFPTIDSPNFGAPGRELGLASDHGRPYQPA